MRFFKTLALSLVFLAIAAAQTLGLSPVWNSADQIAFDAAYKASLPPQLVAYMALPYSSANPADLTRTNPNVILPLARLGLDTQIMVWGWDAYNTDLNRVLYGYVWIPSFGGVAIPVAPGISGANFNPPLPTYNPADPPAGSIMMPVITPAGKMALPAPYLVIAAPAPVVVSDPVGFLEMPFGLPNGIGDWYSVIAGTNAPVGSVTSDTRGTFTKEYVGGIGLMSTQRNVFWVKTN
jgi:hypothetical protein